MERSVQLIVAGGLALVAGLWIEHLAAWQSAAWLVGVAVALVGVLVLAVGTARDLTVGPLERV